MDTSTRVIGSILPKLDELLGDKYNLQKRLRKDVSSVKEVLTSIQAALSNVEEVPLSLQIKQMCREASDLAFHIEHAVDKFQALQLRSANQHAAALKRFIIIAKLMLKLATRKAHLQFASDIRRLNVDLIEFAKRCDKHNTAIPSHTIVPEGLVGLDGRVEELVKILTEEASTSNRQVKIASIHGLPGVGKTALAMQVYQSLKPRFECTAWVSLSPKPVIQEVLGSIIWQITEQDTADPAAVDGEDIIKRITEALKDKRYFIVLDDIWDVKAWDSIEHALMDNSKGSAILTTSNRDDIAGHVGGAYTLAPLPEISARQLLYKTLFGSEENCPLEVKTRSKEILDKCNGIPLAIITAASLLARAQTVLEDWDAVLDSYNGVNRTALEPGVHGAVGLSMDTVPNHIKPCILYLSMFQRGYEISVDRLLWGWIAEGFIPEQDGMTLREKGEEYLIQLIESKLIEVVQVDEASGKALSCRVKNDEVDILIVSATAEENSVTILDWQQGRRLPETVHRLSIQGNNVDHLGPHAQLSHVRSLVVSGGASWFGSSVAGSFQVRKEVEGRWPGMDGDNGDGIDGSPDSAPATQSHLSNFPELRVLDLGGCHNLQYEHLRGLGSLLILRYLVVAGKCITHIPSAIGKLVLLQTLDLRSTCVKELPESVLLMTQLKCLYVNSRTEIPYGIGKMKGLEEAADISINKQGLLEELGDLTKLKFLGIAIWPMGSWENDFFEHALMSYLAILSRQKRNLQRLSISTCFSLNLNKMDGVSLQRLEVSYTFYRFPTWISSVLNLSCLSIDVYKMSEEIIDMLGGLQDLSSLSLTSKHAPEASFGSCTDRFIKLTSFHLMSNAMGKIFEPGSLPKLERLKITFQASRTKEEFQSFDFGLENLSSLEHLSVDIVCFHARLGVVEEAETAIRRARGPEENIEIQRLRVEDMVVDKERWYEDIGDNDEEEEGHMTDNDEEEEGHMKDSDEEEEGHMTDNAEEEEGHMTDNDEEEERHMKDSEEEEKGHMTDNDEEEEGHMTDNDEEEEGHMKDNGEEEEAHMTDNEEDESVGDIQQKETKKMKRTRKFKVGTKRFHEKRKGESTRYKIVSIDIGSQTLTLQALWYYRSFRFATGASSPIEGRCKSART